MRALSCFWLLAIALVAVVDRSSVAQTATGKTAVGQKSDARPKAGEKGTETKGVTAPKMSGDEAAIRKSAESYVAAYGKGDAKAVAEHFTEEAEYVDETGEVTQGRKNIAAELIEHFQESPGAKLELEIESIRFIAPGVAIEDGLTRHTQAGSSEPVINVYTAVHVKVEGKWLVASVRDMAPVIEESIDDRLQELSWLIGEWIDEDEESINRFSCRPSADGNYLLREFSVVIEGKDVLSGTQRITWDPKLGQFRSWTFDSDGGFATGVWHRDGDRWIVTSSGQTGDGESASMTNTYSSISEDSMEFETADLSIGGEAQEMTFQVTLVRSPGTGSAKTTLPKTATEKISPANKPSENRGNDKK